MMRSELLQGRKTEPVRIFGINGKTIWKIEKSHPKKKHWLERWACTISRPHRADWHLSRCTCWTTRQIQQFVECTWYRGKHARHDVDEKTRIQRSDIGDNRCPTSIATRMEYCTYKDRKRLNDKFDPKNREYLEWPSTNWEHYFAKERELPTSSSSFQWSSTSWKSSQEWSSTWKWWQQHSWQGGEWSDQRWSMEQFVKYKLATWNCSRIFEENIHGKIRDLWPPSRFFLIRYFFASSQTQLTERDGRCTQKTSKSVPQHTFSWAHTAHSVAQVKVVSAVIVIPHAHSHPVSLTSLLDVPFVPFLSLLSSSGASLSQSSTTTPACVRNRRITTDAHSVIREEIGRFARSLSRTLPWCHLCGTFRIWVMRNLCGCRHFCDLEVLCEVLQPFGNAFTVAVSRNSFAAVSSRPFVTSSVCWIQRYG